MPLGYTLLELDLQILSSLWHLYLYSEPFPVARPACRAALAHAQHPNSALSALPGLAPCDFFLFLQPKDYPVGDKISGLREDTAECT
jgi:hypothetical protein